MSSAKKSSPGNLPTSTAPDLSIRGDKIALLSPGFSEPLSERDSIDEDSVDSTAQDDGKGDESTVVSHGTRFRQSPWHFFREISLHVSGSGWRSYDNFIGQPIFYSGFSEKMKSSVISSPLLQEKIRYLADKQAKGEKEQGLLRQESMWQDGAENGTVDKSSDDRALESRRLSIQSGLNKAAEGLIDNMICKMESKMFIRGAYYFAIQLLTRAYHQGMRNLIPLALQRFIA